MKNIKNYILLLLYYFTFILIFISCNKEEKLASPTLISPANGETITTATPLFQWLDVENALSYELAVDTSIYFSNPELIYSDIIGTSYIIDTLSTGRHYWRVKAKNGSWSETWSFNLLTILTDIDDNIYELVKIGSQIWTAENLKVTHFSNGDLIPNVTEKSNWKRMTTGAYCAYNNESSNADIYGYLYNGYAVVDIRNIAPVGWHIPTDEDWNILQDFLGGGWRIGYKMIAVGNIEDGTGLWYSPSQGIDWIATNESGFTALPGGWRFPDFYVNADFLGIGEEAYFWSSSVYDNTTLESRTLRYYLLDFVSNATGMIPGMSIRLVQD
jgi:uncharacterized protein (TIGR02145 family)